MILIRRAVIAVIVAGSLLGTACGDAEDATTDAADRAPTVVATTSIWADVVRNVACDNLADVVAIIPPGADPHAFEPSLRDREVLDDAALVVANGLGLEESLTDLLATIDTPILEVTDHVATVRGDDPHVWQDPTRVAGAAPAIGDALIAAGLPAADVHACVEAYVAQLDELDADVASILGTVPSDRRRLVTNHDALGYFADRYGFEVLGTVIPANSALAETNPADLEALAAVVAEAGVPAIFADEQRSSDDARALARRIGGVEVVTLTTDALGEEGSPTATYAGLMRANATEIARALTS
ncbi:MAG TPA: metal ABC transporter substrate-binding protein [Ilumatobacteraceae bacterium]